MAYSRFQGMSNDSLVWSSDKHRVPYFEPLATIACH